MEYSVGADWVELGRERQRMGATGSAAGLEQLEKFLKRAKSTATGTQILLDKVDWAYHTEKRQEDNEENRLRLAQINKWIEWAEALIKERQKEAEAHLGEFLLHDLGRNGKTFGQGFPIEKWMIKRGKPLSELLQSARFVFPTARRRRSTTSYSNMMSHWFDIVWLGGPEAARGATKTSLETSRSQSAMNNLLLHWMARVPAEQTYP
ncbi:hypothetical protein F5Y14DRAFT_463338 [Nemania sp. NC0429]|nr:hypothetical protein F5Y14DRAFT_463338 [Nemania sp. NC0429]